MSAEWKQKGSERECWGGSVTVISIQLCFLSAQWKQEGVRKGMLGWECNCYKYTALCFLSAQWKQEGARERMLGWECNCY